MGNVAVGYEALATDRDRFGIFRLQILDVHASIVDAAAIEGGIVGRRQLLSAIAAGVSGRSVGGIWSGGDFGAGRAAVRVVKVRAQLQFDVVVLDQAVLSRALAAAAVRFVARRHLRLTCEAVVRIAARQLSVLGSVYAD